MQSLYFTVTHDKSVYMQNRFTSSIRPLSCVLERLRKADQIHFFVNYTQLLSFLIDSGEGLLEDRSISSKEPY